MIETLKRYYQAECTRQGYEWRIFRLDTFTDLLIERYSKSNYNYNIDDLLNISVVTLQAIINIRLGSINIDESIDSINARIANERDKINSLVYAEIEKNNREVLRSGIRKNEKDLSKELNYLKVISHLGLADSNIKLLTSVLKTCLSILNDMIETGANNG